jgi:hypothetical protein
VRGRTDLDQLIVAEGDARSASKREPQPPRYTIYQRVKQSMRRQRLEVGVAPKAAIHLVLEHRRIVNSFQLAEENLSLHQVWRTKPLGERLRAFEPGCTMAWRCVKQPMRAV